MLCPAMSLIQMMVQVSFFILTRTFFQQLKIASKAATSKATKIMGQVLQHSSTRTKFDSAI
jgi:hypothetical protein